MHVVGPLLQVPTGLSKDGWGPLLQALVMGMQSDRPIAAWRCGRTGWMCFRRWAAWANGRRSFRRCMQEARTTAGRGWEMLEEDEEEKEFVRVDGDCEQTFETCVMVVMVGSLSSETTSYLV